MQAAEQIESTEDNFIPTDFGPLLPEFARWACFYQVDGYVSWFNGRMGRIAPDGGEAFKDDIYIHSSTVEESKLTNLIKQTRVRAICVDTEKGPRAVAVEVI